MAVFWFGWAKKLKNVFTKKEADQYYLQKNSNQLQQVSGLVDFTSNIVCKRNGYVDNVDPNGPTSMINKRYLEEQTLSKTSTGTQTVAGQTVFSKTGEVIKINSNSDTATYLSGYKSNNQRVWYFGKGSSTSDNFIIGADRSDIKLEPNGKVDLSNKKISWLADPTEDQDAANKRYVDNKTNIEAVFTSGTTIKYQNLAKINENIFDDTNRYDFTKPIYVSFTRYNNNVNLGSWAGTFMYNQDNQYWLIATNMYRSNSTQNMEIGQYVGLLITRSFIQIQCWDTNDRISNIIIKAHLR